MRARTKTRAVLGLTLIEIMVVLTILGLISAAVAVVVVDRLDDARKTRAETDARTLHSALQLYYAKKGTYPPVEAGLDVLARDRLIDAVKRDPWERPYHLFFENGAPVVRSFGRDGQPGGEGIDADIRHPPAAVE